MSQLLQYPKQNRSTVQIREILSYTLVLSLVTRAGQLAENQMGFHNPVKEQESKDLLEGEV